MRPVVAKVDRVRATTARILFALLSLLPIGAFAQQVYTDLASQPTGKIQFNSLTPKSYYALLRQTSQAPQTTIFGYLYFPQGIQGRVPAMVISHGSGGIMANVTERWKPLFLKMGMAVFIVDSYGPRGIGDTVANQNQLSFGASIADALSALKLLATDPRIDPSRIGEIGFSRGGSIAVNTMLEKFRAAVIPDAATKFAAHIAFYPACDWTYWGERSPLTGAPIMFALGAKDDYVSTQLCVNYAQKLKTVLPKVAVHVYEGAYHDFDAMDAGRHWIAGAVSNIKCPGIETDIDSLKVTDLGTAKQYKTWDEYSAAVPSCMSKGGTVAGSQSAAAQSEADVRAFLMETMGLK